MKNTIKRLLREVVNDRFLDSVSKRLDKMNAKEANGLDIDIQTWRLGSEIMYKTLYRNRAHISWCLKWGSPEQRVLMDEWAMISNVNDYDDYDENELKVYCDIINRYYDLESPIPKDETSIRAFLSRKFEVTILDGDADEYDVDLGGLDDEHLTIGYRYNDFDEHGEVGEGSYEVIDELERWFNLDIEQAQTILHKWTYDRIQNGNYN